MKWVKLPLFMLHISYMRHFNILLFDISWRGDEEFVSSWGECNRFLQLIRTRTTDTNSFSLLCLFTFQQTSDKINEELLIIVSVKKTDMISFNTWSQIFFSAQFTYYIGRWGEKQGDGNWKWKGEHQTLSLIKHEILAW